jgi:DNA-directed RNA polymerase subunit alpha
MSEMVMPKIEVEEEAGSYGKYVISPLEKGYGVTLGNALRRVLLSSLEGAAITSMRLEGVLHEFSAIPGVREDVIQAMLQIKQIRLILHEGDTAQLRLSVSGEGVVTAADIQVPAEVEIINPELYLFTADESDAKVEIDFTVERGRGYSPAGDRTGKLPIGELPVDAIFNPVTRVNFTIGSARVGQSTNYDRLDLQIWTDGTIAPKAGLGRAAHLLIDHLRLITEMTGEPLTRPKEGHEVKLEPTSNAMDTPIEQLDLSMRVFNSLKRTGINTVGDILELLEKGDDAVMSIRNFGEKSLDELLDKLREKGFLPEETPEEPQ